MFINRNKKSILIKKQNKINEKILLQLNFEKYTDKYDYVCYRKFSWSIRQTDENTFVYDWLGGNTIIRNAHHLNKLYFWMNGKHLF